MPKLECSPERGASCSAYDSVEVVTSNSGDRIEIDDWKIDCKALADPLSEGLFSKPIAWTMYGVPQHVQTDNGNRFARA